MLVALVAHRLSGRRERRARFATASGKFRSAFADALLNLEHYDTSTSEIVNETHVGQRAAIHDLRPHLPWWRRFGFEGAVRHYDKCVEYYHSMGTFTQFASERNSDAQAARGELKASIEKLLSYARQT